MKSMDQLIHQDRIDATGNKVFFTEAIGDLPDGVMFTGRDRGPCLLWGRKRLQWVSNGYKEPETIDASTIVAVLTPASVVQTIAGGFIPKPYFGQ